MKKLYLMMALLVSPSCLFLSPAFAGTATVRWQANTDSDLSGYRVYYGTTSRVYRPAISLGKVTSHTFTDLTDGDTYFFSVTAVDTAGNESGYSAEVSKTIPAAQPESDPPTVTITSPTNSSGFATSSSSILLVGTASDNVGVTLVSWANSSGGSGTASGTADWSANIILAQGQNVITVRARDAAGNEAACTLTVTYTPPVEADTVAPSIGITAPTESNFYFTRANTLDVSGLAWDNVAVEKVTWRCSAGGSGVATGTTNWSISDIPLSSWQNEITVTAMDRAGNTVSDSLRVYCWPSRSGRQH